MGDHHDIVVITKSRGDILQHWLIARQNILVVLPTWTPGFNIAIQPAAQRRGITTMSIFRIAHLIITGKNLMNSRAHFNVHAKRRQPDGGFKRTRSQHRSLLCTQSNRGDKTAQAALLAFPCSNQMSQFNAHIRGLFTAAFGQFCPGWTSIQQTFYVGKCLAVAQQDDSSSHNIKPSDPRAPLLPKPLPYQTP